MKITNRLKLRQQYKWIIKYSHEGEIQMWKYHTTWFQDRSKQWFLLQVRIMAIQDWQGELARFLASVKWALSSSRWSSFQRYVQSEKSHWSLPTLRISVHFCRCVYCLYRAREGGRGKKKEKERWGDRTQVSWFCLQPKEFSKQHFSRNKNSAKSSLFPFPCSGKAVT